MNKYLVTLYICSSVNILVEAENEDDAYLIAEESGWEYLSDIDLDIESADVISEDDKLFEHYFIDLDLTEE